MGVSPFSDLEIARIRYARNGQFLHLLQAQLAHSRSEPSSSTARARSLQRRSICAGAICRMHEWDFAAKAANG
jgi:hypothetical protein